MKEELKKYINELKEERGGLLQELNGEISNNQRMIKVILVNRITETIYKLEKIINL